MGFFEGGGGNFRQADGADFALLHQIGQRADAFFNRDVFIPTVQVVEVDHIGLQALQRGFALLLEGGGAAVDYALAVNAAHAAFAGEENLFSVGFERFADQGFVGAEAVKGGGIEMVAAELDRAL